MVGRFPEGTGASETAGGAEMKDDPHANGQTGFSLDVHHPRQQCGRLPRRVLPCRADEEAVSVVLGFFTWNSWNPKCADVKDNIKGRRKIALFKG